MDQTRQCDADRGIVTWMLLAAIAWLIAMFVTGCSMKDKSLDEQRQTLEMWTTFAKENNVSMIAQVDIDGRIGLVQESVWALKLPVKGSATFMYQPAIGLPPSLATEPTP